MSNHYSILGVSSQKEDVHAAIKNLDMGLYPGTFCKILPDYLTGDPNYCLVMHADGTGTKSSAAYFYWKETGDLSVMKNIPQDAVVMNLDDTLCVGATGPFIIDQTINRNKFNIPAEALSEIIEGTEIFLSRLRDFGVPIYHGGGETADVGDVVQTFIIDNSMVTRIKRTEVIDCSHIAPGNIIVGLCSYGPPATYETAFNSGLGSNGLTAARHDVFAKYLAHKYPELYDHKNLNIEQVFTGSYRVNDVIPDSPLNIGELVLSPTRTYAPIVLDFLKTIDDRSRITGIIHCSGGGQTKCLKFVNNVHIIKDNLFPVPTVFDIIYNKGKKMDMKEMYSNFNMGHRMEVYCENQEIADMIIASSNKFNVSAQVIGRCEACEGKRLTIHHGDLILEY